jgi:hypothetical protein
MWIATLDGTYLTINRPFTERTGLTLQAARERKASPQALFGPQAQIVSRPIDIDHHAHIVILPS